MSRLAYIFYMYIKANMHQTPPKLLKAIEEIQKVRRNLPLHLSQHFPANDDDREWEQQHEWVTFQRYLMTIVLDFLELGIARVIVSRDTEDDPERSRKLAIACANRILHNYSLQVPRPYRLVWTVSAAVVAAAVYISLDMLANPHDYRDNVKAQTTELLSHAAAELKRHSEVAMHAAKGCTMIENLLLLVSQDPPAVPRTPCTVHDLVKELSSSHQDVSLENLQSSFPDPVAAYMSLLENESNFGQYQASFGDMLDGEMNEWDTFMLGV
jgi:hypothetical protein